MFVANRIHQIKENTRSDHWKHVSNKENPTDDASCGLDPRKETSNSCWFHGPSFLWQVESLWPIKDCSIGSLKDDVELKREATLFELLMMCLLILKDKSQASPS